MMTEQLLHQLLFLIVYADNIAHEREILLAQNMCLMAGFDADISEKFKDLIHQDRYHLLKKSVDELKKLPKDLQIRTVAKLCIIANADGFMDKDEWQLIYSIYHNELKLHLDDVLQTQREIVVEMKEKEMY